ncbi:MAG: hypothetical protein ACTHLZ_05075 [Tepidisphaeraceae bacterium]
MTLNAVGSPGDGHQQRIVEAQHHPHGVQDVRLPRRIFHRSVGRDRQIDRALHRGHG